MLVRREGPQISCQLKPDTGCLRRLVNDADPLSAHTVIEGGSLTTPAVTGPFLFVQKNEAGVALGIDNTALTMTHFEVRSDSEKAVRKTLTMRDLGCLAGLGEQTGIDRKADNFSPGFDAKFFQKASAVSLDTFYADKHLGRDLRVGVPFGYQF